MRLSLRPRNGPRYRNLRARLNHMKRTWKPFFWLSSHCNMGRPYLPPWLSLTAAAQNPCHRPHIYIRKTALYELLSKTSAITLKFHSSLAPKTYSIILIGQKPVKAKIVSIRRTKPPQSCKRIARARHQDVKCFRAYVLSTLACCTCACFFICMQTEPGAPLQQTAHSGGR